MRLNQPTINRERTHEGALAVPHLRPEAQLRRSVMSCLLWEDQFYENGESIADRIEKAANQVAPDVLAGIAIEARDQHNLRHVPLLLLDTLANTGSGIHTSLVRDTIARVIQRPDELAELLAVHWRNGRKMIPHQMQKGLDKAFRKFDEYQLAKYDRDGAIKLRDVLRLVRPKPTDDLQAALWGKTKNRTLKTPDTWEVELSAGGDKRETFTRLLNEGKLGYLALLRNLRNMDQAGVNGQLIDTAIIARKGGAHRVLPFRFVAAARAAPQHEVALDVALRATIEEMPKLPGMTFVLVDVSGSMDMKLSTRSDMTRMDAAAALGAIVSSERLRLFTFSNSVVECPPRRGMAGVDAITRSQMHGGTYLGQAVELINTMPHDRLIVVTDEQSHDRVTDPRAEHAYMINTGSYKNGVGYGRWIHIDGFSESILKFIYAVESTD